jgi:spore germination protein YaaH
LKRFDTVVVTGFKIEATGIVSYRFRGTMGETSRITASSGIILYPLITFKSSGVGHRILNDPSLSEKTCLHIKRLVRDRGFKGVHLDFEYLPPQDAARLSDFIKRLRRHIPGKTITMAVFPQVDFPEKLSRFHDLKIIAPVLDGIVLMCYDYHRIGTGPGPVSDLKWAEKNIRYSLSYFPAHKIWLGVPAYGYRWPDSGRATAVSARHGMKLARSYKPVRHESGCLYLDYISSGKRYMVYFADRFMRDEMVRLAEKYGLAGTALWRIGFEE